MAKNAASTTTGNGQEQPEVRFGHSESAIKEREKMAKEIEKKIIDPLGLLAGILASVHDEKDTDVSGTLNSLGELLGLINLGMRKELDFQTLGVDRMKMYELMFETMLEKEAQS